jgi:hypothetical protein
MCPMGPEGVEGMVRPSGLFAPKPAATAWLGTLTGLRGPPRHRLLCSGGKAILWDEGASKLFTPKKFDRLTNDQINHSARF